VSIFLVRRFLLVAVCLTLSACVNHERRYDFEGRVVSNVLATRTLVVDHENIPGFMPAMTMPYPVANGVDLSGVEAGDRIKARVVVHRDERYELDKVLVTVPSPENLRRLADAFGLIYQEEENQIVHSLSTVLIDPQGRLVKEWTVSDWTAPEAVAAIRRVESAKN
jgi:Cu/Ag efflux protein CusF